MVATPAEVVISVQELRKSYGSTVAVDGASFEVDRGEIFGILGRNGAGKTVTVECLQGLRRPDSGTLRVLGLDPVTAADAVRRRIGSQLQESALPDRIKVWEALDLFATFTPTPVDWRVLLDEWGLAEKRNAAFAGLSGGQRQRLFIALALISSPEIVFLDEMTTGLDPAARRVAWDLMRSVRERGTTVVLVTHFMDEAEELCDRICIFDAGHVVDVDSPSGIIRRHGGSVRIRFTAPPQPVNWLQQVEGVQRVSVSEGTCEIQGDGRALALVAHALVEHGIVPSDLRVEQASLEAAFLRITGHGFHE
jgi:ABC-2 type transport system ATP-binding protein